MRTNIVLTAGRALALLGALAVFAPPAALADEPVAPAADQIVDVRLEAGYRVADADGDRSLLFPYAPLTDGPIFALDLLYLTPAFGTLDVEALYRDEDSWFAEAEYHRGSKVDLHAGMTKSTRAREHRAALPELNVPNPNIDAATGLPLDPIETESRDADPGAEYSLTRREGEVALRVRAPGYPAHLRLSGRIVDRRGSEQLFSHYRSCGTHFCHTNSRTREIDQRTEEFSLGGDAHLGPVDVAYTHTRWNYRDRAPDPVDFFEDATGTLMNYPATRAFNPPGEYVHSVNPDVRSFVNLLRLNTNLASRTVFSLYWRGEEQENESAGITRAGQRAEASASHTFSRDLFASLRLAWQHEVTDELSTKARQLRLDNNRYHSGQSHQHVVEPDDTQRSAELLVRWDLLPAGQLRARLRHGDRERHALIGKVGTAFVDEPRTTRETLARIEGRYRFGGGVTVDASLGREWTDNPTYATENTGLTRFGAGATWAASKLLSLQASYQGYRGENDDRDALGSAYDGPRPEPLSRSVDGDAFSLAAVLTPAETLTLTAVWLLNDAGVDQDLVLGAFSPPGFAYY
ncbi:MAG TPA: hypothetical protein VN317_09190, partial [Candidatus Methanoperedens sp.]|nr:hypothetical protein [Candidatus Methanoperedens sp.]